MVLVKTLVNSFWHCKYRMFLLLRIVCFVYVIFFFQLSLFSGSLLPKEAKHGYKMVLDPSCM